MHDIVTFVVVPSPISLVVGEPPLSICTPNVIASQAILRSCLANLLTQRSRCVPLSTLMKMSWNAFPRILIKQTALTVFGAENPLSFYANLQSPN